MSRSIAAAGLAAVALASIFIFSIIFVALLCFSSFNLFFRCISNALKFSKFKRGPVVSALLYILDRFRTVLLVFRDKTGYTS